MFYYYVESEVNIMEEKKLKWIEGLFFLGILFEIFGSIFDNLYFLSIIGIVFMLISAAISCYVNRKIKPYFILYLVLTILFAVSLCVIVAYDFL